MKLQRTWAQVCKKKGISNKIPFDVSKLPKEMHNYLIACYQSAIVIEVLNDGWVPDYTDHRQYKYELCFSVKADKKRPSGFGLSCVGCDNFLAYSRVGVRHCFKDYQTLRHAERYFKKMFEHLLLKIGI